MLNNCEWLLSISNFPLPTVPNQDYSLPFHVVSSNQFKISYKNVELTYQTQKRLDTEAI